MNTTEQHELYEKARNTVKQQKFVYYHFILFLVGAAFVFVVNKILKLGNAYGNWYQWVIVLWFFGWVIHCVQVFIVNRFFGTDWERAETDKLMIKHAEKLKKLEQQLLDKTPKSAE